MFTQNDLKKYLTYDPESGVFTRVHCEYAPANGRRMGKPAGWIARNGYVRIAVCGEEHPAHRLAFVYMNGQWPGEVDHINGIRTDNRWSNLRQVTRGVNNQNRRTAASTSKTGLLGVCANGNGFSATIQVDGIRHCLGTFKTPEEAHAKYLSAKRILHEGNTL